MENLTTIPLLQKKPAFFLLPKKRKDEVKRKQQWYKIGKVIKRGHKVSLHRESKLAARRTYEYYSIEEGNWVDPSSRQFSKMVQSEFQQYLDARIKVRDQVLLDFFLEEMFEVEGPTSSSGGNMLESDGRLENHVINGSLDLGHEGIGDV